MCQNMLEPIELDVLACISAVTAGLLHDMKVDMFMLDGTGKCVASAMQLFHISATGMTEWSCFHGPLQFFYQLSSFYMMLFACFSHSL